MAKPKNKKKLVIIVSYEQGDGTIQTIRSDDEDLEQFHCSVTWDSHLIYRFKDNEFTAIVPRHRIVLIQADVRKDFFKNHLED